LRVDVHPGVPPGMEAIVWRRTEGPTHLQRLAVETLARASGVVSPISEGIVSHTFWLYAVLSIGYDPGRGI
jgi:hypothetical protein